MCKECNMTPCHPRCPNATTEGTLVCINCSETIEYGSDYAEIGENKICYYCFDNMSKEELIDALGGQMKIAEMPEPDFDPYDSYGDDF